MPLDIHKIALILVFAAVAPALVACGRRGPLELPPGATADCAVPAAAPPGASPAEPGSYSNGGPAPPAPPCTSKTSPRPFFLDPLL